jgi:hypothetical protein
VEFEYIHPNIKLTKLIQKNYVIWLAKNNGYDQKLARIGHIYIKHIMKIPLIISLIFILPLSAGWFSGGGAKKEEKVSFYEVFDKDLAAISDGSGHSEVNLQTSVSSDSEAEYVAPKPKPKPEPDDGKKPCYNILCNGGSNGGMGH